MIDKFNILTFNGGGIRGIISGTFIDRLTNEFPKFIDKTNMLGGTSTGALIAVALAYGLSPSKIKELYSIENSKYVFSPAYSSILRPKYNSDHLLDQLKQTFPADLTLKDLKKTIVIPTVYLGDLTSSSKPMFYSNLPGSKTANSNVIDVLMATSAAPSYFPSYQKQVDGGIVAYDPSLICLLYALGFGEDMLGKINILSMATGSSNIEDGIKGDTTTWGATQWMLNPEDLEHPLLKLSIISNATMSYLVTSKILKEKYHRLNLTYDGNIDLDDYTKIPYLQDLAENHDINDSLSWIQNFWE